MREAIGSLRGVELLLGPDAAEQLAKDTEADIVLNALVGSSGLGPDARRAPDRQDARARQQGVASSWAASS